LNLFTERNHGEPLHQSTPVVVKRQTSIDSEEHPKSPKKKKKKGGIIATIIKKVLPKKIPEESVVKENKTSYGRISKKPKRFNS
jgi:hypothetical protein